MTKTVRGVVRGKTIVLDEEIGVADGQPVEVQVRTLPSPEPPGKAGLAAVNGILGERYQSGHADTAARHDEHQP